MDLTKTYYDGEGNEVDILKLVKKDPEWAANIIQFYECKVAELRAQHEIDEKALRILAVTVGCPPGGNEKECEDITCSDCRIAYAREKAKIVEEALIC